MKNYAITKQSAPLTVEVPEGSVRIIESHHSPEFQMQMDTWNFHKICWVVIGEGQLQTDSRHHPITKDDFLILPSEFRHRFVDQPGNPLTLIILCASGSMHSKMRMTIPNSVSHIKSGYPLKAKSNFLHEELIQLFRSALREQDKELEGWEDNLQAIYTMILSRFVRGSCVDKSNTYKTKEYAIEDALNYMEEHLHKPLSLDDMAERCNMSTRRFTELFRIRAGMTFNNYLSQIRIQFACKRLKETGHVLYACHESGFNDLSYFYRVFKKITGQTPKEYILSTKR